MPTFAKYLPRATARFIKEHTITLRFRNSRRIVHSFIYLLFNLPDISRVFYNNIKYT